MDDKDYAPKLELLNRSNYEGWFRKMSLKLRAKGVWYVVELDKKAYATGATFSAPSTPETPAEGSNKDKVDEVTAKLASLKIEKDSEKLAEKLLQYDKDEAIALNYVVQALSDEDATKVDELIRAKAVWHSLKTKYCRSSPVEVVTMIQKIQNFEYTEEKGIYSGWAEMKEYRRKLGLADSAMRNAYPDSTLFAMFSLKLPDRYEATIDGFRTTTAYDEDEKIKILADKEDSLKARTTVQSALAARSARSRSPRQRHHYSRHSNSSEDGEARCFVCKERDHLMRDCPYLDVARRAAKADRKKSSSRSSSQKSVSFEHPRKPSLKPLKKAKALLTADNSKQNATSSEESDSETDAEAETVLLSQDKISKHPGSWPLDSACTAHMADQPSYFRSALVPIKRTPIQVGGGVLYARQKGTAEVRALDGTSMLVSDCLFVPDLGISLLSVRRLCEAGLKGEIDHKKLYLKRGTKTIIKAKMTNGLYLVSSVALEGEKQAAFTSIEIDTQNAEPCGRPTVRSHNEETGSKSTEQEEKDLRPLTTYSH
jgi:gag-polypeptide of LTR copia-type